MEWLVEKQAGIDIKDRFEVNTYYVYIRLNDGKKVCKTNFLHFDHVLEIYKPFFCLVTMVRKVDSLSLSGAMIVHTDCELKIGK